MPDKPAIWTENYRVAWHEATPGNQAGIVALCNYLQETAWKHASHLGFGYHSEKGFEKAWVMVRLHIELSRLPAWDEEIEIVTWPRGTKAFFAYRDFVIRDKKGEVIASATSTWLLIDMEHRKPVQIDFVPPIGYKLSAQLACGIEAPTVRLPKTKVIYGNYNVRFFDLDMYQHVNNARFIEILVGAYPYEWLMHHSLRSLSVEFLKEGKPGDELEIAADELPALVNTLVVANKSGSVPLVRARLIWGKHSK